MRINGPRTSLNYDNPKPMSYNELVDAIKAAKKVIALVCVCDEFYIEVPEDMIK